MRYEELETEAQYLAETDAELPYDKDELLDIYKDPTASLEDDAIEDWEEGIILGEQQAYA